MTQEIQGTEKVWRYRSKVSTSAKGVQQPECTVEHKNFTMEEHLAELDKLVAALKERYPIKVE